MSLADEICRSTSHLHITPEWNAAIADDKIEELIASELLTYRWIHLHVRIPSYLRFEFDPVGVSTRNWVGMPFMQKEV